MTQGVIKIINHEMPCQEGNIYHANIHKSILVQVCSTSSVHYKLTRDLLGFGRDTIMCAMSVKSS